MKKVFSVVFAAFAFLFFFQSCQKIDTTDLGIGLIPTVDNVNTFDTTLSVRTYNSFLPDTSNVGRNQEHALGVMEDPEFGRTSANIFFEILPATAGTSPFGIADSIRGIDSVVLTLDYSGFYGDSNAVERFTVHEIAQSAKFEDATYNVGGPEIIVEPRALGNVTVDFKTLNDPKYYKQQGKDTAVSVDQNVLRIRLDQSLGVRLSRLDTTAFKTDSAFRKVFKGLAIKADTIASQRKKALAYFKISDNSKTRLAVYYRTVRNGITDTIVSNFAYRATASVKNVGFAATHNANIIRRNIIGTNYAANLATGNGNQENLYIQSSPGSYATMEVQGLSGLSNRVIHKADLIIEKLSSAEENFFPPPILFLDVLDTVKKRVISVTNDFSTDFQGQYNIREFGGIIDNNRYTFNLTRHIQGLVTRKEPVFKYRLYAPFETWPTYFPEAQGRGIPLTVNPKVAAGRVVIAGGNHSAKKLRLRIIYSLI